MNIDGSEGKGGANIKPSARKSIHSYKNNLLRPESMARYGLNQPSKQNDKSHNKETDKGQGEDVVDNVMSKFSRQTSPLSIRRPTKIQRWHSLSQDEEHTDDNINVLSKSLPATLPSHLSYSTDSDIEEPNISSNSRTRSRIESEDEIHQYISNRSSELPQPSPYSRKLSVSPRDKGLPQSQSGSHSYIIWMAVVIGIIGTIYMKLPYFITSKSHDKSTQTVNHEKIIFENNMDILKEKYNIDNNSILKLKTGISTIFSRMDTGSFMFLYNSKTKNFNPVKFEKFTDEVAYTTARYLRNDMPSIQHTVVESANLDMQEHGELINRYRNDVDRSGVMLVKEIDAVPSNLAMAFHYYCDEYEPLVKRSAIFFTLNMANCSNASEIKSMHYFIEKCLETKWKTVPSENMKPLLTRVVDIIIDVSVVF